MKNVEKCKCKSEVPVQDQAVMNLNVYKTCSTCRHGLRVVHLDITGDIDYKCRRYPPTLLFWPFAPSGAEPRQYRPFMHDKDTCGEWTQK